MWIILTLCQFKGSSDFCGGLQTSRTCTDEGSVNPWREHPPARKQVFITASGIVGIKREKKAFSSFFELKAF